MTDTLRFCEFSSNKLEGECCSALIDAKWRTLAILHDCQDMMPATTQIFNQLAALPDVNDLKYRQAEPEEWLACAVKALIEADVAEADHAVKLERYVATALEHAGRILKHKQGLQVGQKEGYQKHVVETTAERAKNLQKAEVAKTKKGKATRQAIIQCHEKLLQVNGNFHGLDAAVAKEVGVSPQRVSQVMGGKR